VQVRLFVVGKVKAPYYREACAEYEKRLSRFVRFESVEASTDSKFEKLLHKGELVFCLDEHGKSFTTRALADLLKQNERVVFLMGDTDGLNPELKKKYPSVALSSFTFSHELARVVFMEQLYRCMTLLSNHPYHRD
jgi:23S rRNA (pseudouridine1915-N3)-methyltransferase